MNQTHLRHHRRSHRSPGWRSTAEPRLHMDVEMLDEDAEDNMPLSELMELKKRKDMEMAPTGVKVDKELMQAVRRVHNNLGHPEASKLVRALRIAGARPEAIEAAKLLKCDVCKQLEQPSTRRPTHTAGTELQRPHRRGPVLGEGRHRQQVHDAQRGRRGNEVPSRHAGEVQEA